MGRQGARLRRAHGPALCLWLGGLLWLLLRLSLLLPKPRRYPASTSRPAGLHHVLGLAGLLLRLVATSARLGWPAGHAGLCLWLPLRIRACVLQSRWGWQLLLAVLLLLPLLLAVLLLLLPLLLRVRLL